MFRQLTNLRQLGEMKILPMVILTKQKIANSQKWKCKNRKNVRKAKCIYCKKDRLTNKDKFIKPEIWNRLKISQLAMVIYPCGWCTTTSSALSLPINLRIAQYVCMHSHTQDSPNKCSTIPQAIKCTPAGREVRGYEIYIGWIGKAA